jgi:predicted phage tail protein
VTIPLKKVSSVKAALTPSAGGSTYKFTWAANPAAVSYSINIVTPEGKKTLTSQTPTINLENLIPGSYSIEIQAIDIKGKLSTPALSKFALPAPKVVKLTTTATLSKPVVSATLAATLDRFSLQTTPGRSMKLVIEYSKSKSNDLNVKKLADAVKKYLAVKREDSPVVITLSLVKDSGALAVIKGVGEKESPSLLLRR